MFFAFLYDIMFESEREIKENDGGREIVKERKKLENNISQHPQNTAPDYKNHKTEKCYNGLQFLDIHIKIHIYTTLRKKYVSNKRMHTNI